MNRKQHDPLEMNVAARGSRWGPARLSGPPVKRLTWTARAFLDWQIPGTAVNRERMNESSRKELP